MKGPTAPIQPQVLRWARETAGLTEAEAAKRIAVSLQRLVDAESGAAELTLRQARMAADAYSRPFATLFLQAPPAEESLDVQFRRLRDAPPLPWSSDMRALARLVPELQDEAVALFEALDHEPRWGAVRAQLAAGDASSRAAILRAAVGVPLDLQRRVAADDPKGFAVFRLWREAIEEFGVLVLQDGTLAVDQMRGFLAPHPRVPAIVINTGDDPRARLFTLIHEFAHLVVPDERDELQLERFAADVLMPSAAFSAGFAAQSGRDLLVRVDRVARGFGVTPHAAANRVGWLDLAPWPEVREAIAAIKERATGGVKPGGGDYYRNVVARLGPGLVGRVLAGLDQGVLSHLAASRLLGVRVEKFGEIRKTLRGADAA